MTNANYSSFFVHCVQCDEEQIFTRSNQKDWIQFRDGNTLQSVCPDCVKTLKSEHNNCQTPSEIIVFLSQVQEALGYEK